MKTDVNSLDKVDEDLTSHLEKNKKSASEMDDIPFNKIKDAYEKNCEQLLLDLTDSLRIVRGISNFEDFNTTRNKLKNRELKPPKSCNKSFMKCFKISSTERKYKLVGDSLNEHLKKFLIGDINIATDHPSLDTKISYDDLLKFLQNRKGIIKMTEMKSLKDLCIYGHLLQKFFDSYLYLNEESEEKKNKTFAIYLEENLNLSESYARKLRWLGNT